MIIVPAVPPRSFDRRRAVPFASLPVVLGFAAQWRVLQSDLHRDDFLHLYDLVNDGLATFLVTPYGGHLYVFRNLFFAVAYHLFGLSGAPYFWLVMGVHLLNAGLFYAVLRRETGSAPLAALAASLWSTSPLHAQALEWFSAIGHPLATTFCLAAVHVVDGSRVERFGSRWLAAVLLLAVGSTCFGIGTAFALVFPAVVWLRLPPPLRVKGAACLGASLVLIPALYLVTGLLARCFGAPDGFNEITPGDFLATMWSVPRFLAYFLLYGTAALPFLSSLLLAFDEALRLPLSLLAAGGLAAVVIAAEGEARRRIAAWLLLAVAAYGVIAAGRTWFYLRVERTLWSAAREPRHHYAGQLALCAAAAAAAAAFGRRHAVTSVRLAPAAAASALGVCLLNLRTGYYHELWPSGRGELARLQSSIAERVLAQPPGAVVCMHNETFANVDFWVIGLREERFPGAAAVYLVWNDPDLAKRRVYFTEPRPRVLAYVRGRNGRVKDILVGPDECPDGARGGPLPLRDG